MPRLFIDLDGVLADFDEGAERVLGMTPRLFEQLHGVPLMWKRLAEHDGFYAGLDWLRGGRTLWREVNEASTWDGPPPMILTGLPLGTWAEPQKRAWCRDKLGEGVAVISCLSKDKAMYCCAGDILIDDRAEARAGWENANGRFIHHVSATESLAALAALVADAA